MQINWQKQTTKKGLWDWGEMRALVPDSETAKVLRCNKTSVFQARKAHGIAAHRIYRAPEMQISRPDLSWSFVKYGVWDMKNRVARMDDTGLARMMKCDPAEVRQRREAAGVKPLLEMP